MVAKPVIVRALADLDIDAAFEHYLSTGGSEIGLRFAEEVAKAFAHISRHPGTGSPKYGRQLNIPGLRAWTLSRYPFIVFYLEMAEAVEVVRVLHGAMDLPEWLDL